MDFTDQSHERPVNNHTIPMWNLQKAFKIAIQLNSHVGYRILLTCYFYL